MMFPKPKLRKKRKRKTPVPLSQNKCAWCDSTYRTEIHHVYGGNHNRELSNEYACVEWLCAKCHRECKGDIDPVVDLFLKAKRQTMYELAGRKRSEFISTFGMCYRFKADEVFGKEHAIKMVAYALDGGTPKEYYDRYINPQNVWKNL